MSVGTYVFVGFRADGSSAAVDLQHCSGAKEALVGAERFLELHRSCVAAEIWHAGKLADVIGHPDAVALLRPTRGLRP